MEGRLGAPL